MAWGLMGISRDASLVPGRQAIKACAASWGPSRWGHKELDRTVRLSTGRVEAGPEKGPEQLVLVSSGQLMVW